MTTVKKIILLYSTLPITDRLTHWLTTLKYRATQLLLKYKSGALVTQWGNGERFTLYISSFSLYFLPLYPFPKPKIVSFCRKMSNMSLLSQCHKKNLSYALWENNSGSNSLRESSASCAGLIMEMVMVMVMVIITRWWWWISVAHLSSLTSPNMSPPWPNISSGTHDKSNHFTSITHIVLTCAWPVLQHKKASLASKRGKKDSF